MKKIFIGVLTLSLMIGVTSCKDKEANDQEDVYESTEMNSEEGYDEDSMDMDELEMETESVVIAMGSKSGSNVSGTITLTQNGTMVNMVADFNGFTPGTHAIHIHQNGDCSSDDGKSAGGHWNPTEEMHGKWGNDMHHSGDIGNLEADEDGNASLTFETDKWCLNCDDENKNVIGKSFIVHASADDFESQPSGAAGAREACGVIE
jgi:Cu-Zn family superoxide dismutase